MGIETVTSNVNPDQETPSLFNYTIITLNKYTMVHHNLLEIVRTHHGILPFGIKTWKRFTQRTLQLAGWAMFSSSRIQVTHSDVGGHV